MLIKYKLLNDFYVFQSNENLKKLGFLVVTNNQGLNCGIFTDGDLKRLMQKKRKIEKPPSPVVV